MEILQSHNCDETDWLKFLQEALLQDTQTGVQKNLELLAETPAFLKRLLIAFLSVMSQGCALNGLEVTRLLDLDYLAAISDDLSLAFRLTQDCGGRHYLQVTVGTHL